MYYRQVFVLLKCKLTNKIRNDKKSRPNCEEIKRHFSKIKRRFISLKRPFVRLKRRFVFLKNSNYLTLLPFPGDYFKVSFTRGATLTLCSELSSFGLSARGLCKEAITSCHALKWQKRPST